MTQLYIVQLLNKLHENQSVLSSVHSLVKKKKNWPHYSLVTSSDKESKLKNILRHLVLKLGH